MKYIIYKGSGGLFHNLRGLSHAIQLARDNNNILIIDMQSHVPFGGRFGDYFTMLPSNLVFYDNYDTVPEKITRVVKEGHAGIHGYAPDHGVPRRYTIDHDKDYSIMYGYQGGPVDPHIKVNESVFDRIKSDNRSIDKKYISVHYRNTDIQNDSRAFCEKIKTAVNRHNIHVLYLATDDRKFKSKIETMLPQLEVIQKVNLPDKEIANLQTGTHDPQKQMYECLQDIYNIFTSDVFIPSMNSSFSQCIVEMIQLKRTLFPGVVSRAIVAPSG